jgi:hypothetical protein
MLKLFGAAILMVAASSVYGSCCEHRFFYFGTSDWTYAPYRESVWSRPSTPVRYSSATIPMYSAATRVYVSPTYTSTHPERYDRTTTVPASYTIRASASSRYDTERRSEETYSDEERDDLSP